MKFSLQRLLLIVMTLSVLIWAVPQVVYRFRTWPIQQQLAAWQETQTSDTPTYKSCCIVNFGGSAFYVSRAQQEYDSISDQWFYTESKQPDGALFVAPPGKWCKSTDDAIQCIWETSFHPLNHTKIKNIR